MNESEAREQARHVLYCVLNDNPSTETFFDACKAAAKLLRPFVPEPEVVDEAEREVLVGLNNRDEEED